jgi:hypothetical protein
MRIEVWGDHLLSPQERKKGELSRERGITAFPSEAIFAATYDQPYLQQKLSEERNYPSCKTQTKN